MKRVIHEGPRTGTYTKSTPGHFGALKAFGDDDGGGVDKSCLGGKKQKKKKKQTLLMTC